MKGARSEDEAAGRPEVRFYQKHLLFFEGQKMKSVRGKRQADQTCDSSVNIQQILKAKRAHFEEEEAASRPEVRFQQKYSSKSKGEENMI